MGRGRRLRDGDDVALVSVGTVGNAAARAAERAAAEGVSAAHYDLRWVKPLDEELLDEVGRRFRRVITVEDGSLRGGVGEAVAAYFNARGYGRTSRASVSATLGSNTALRRSSTPSAGMTRSRFSAPSWTAGRRPPKKQVLRPSVKAMAGRSAFHPVPRGQV